MITCMINSAYPVPTFFFRGISKTFFHKHTKGPHETLKKNNTKSKFDMLIYLTPNYYITSWIYG